MVGSTWFGRILAPFLNKILGLGTVAINRISDSRKSAGTGMLNMIKTLVIFLILSAMVSCTEIYRRHGYTPSEEQLANVVVGVDTRASVEESLGGPITGGNSTVDSFYYISSRWLHYGLAQPKPTFRQIVAINFDKSDVVNNISRYELADGEVVVLSRRVTAGGAKEISFIKQLMGNIGRIDTEQILQQP
jgi:outer membrane protein assembly factor BamE (lipoprotein component of BamABCDE complex)